MYRPKKLDFWGNQDLLIKCLYYLLSCFHIPSDTIKNLLVPQSLQHRFIVSKISIPKTICFFLSVYIKNIGGVLNYLIAVHPLSLCLSSTNLLYIPFISISTLCVPLSAMLPSETRSIWSASFMVLSL